MVSPWMKKSTVPRSLGPTIGPRHLFFSAVRSWSCVPARPPKLALPEPSSWAWRLPILAPSARASDLRRRPAGLRRGYAPPAMPEFGPIPPCSSAFLPICSQPVRGRVDVVRAATRVAAEHHKRRQHRPSFPIILHLPQARCTSPLAMHVAVAVPILAVSLSSLARAANQSSRRRQRWAQAASCESDGH